MKKLVVFSLIVSLALALALVWGKGFGNLAGLSSASLFALSALGGWFLFSLLSLVLLRTRYREVVEKTWLVAGSTVFAYLVVDAAAGYLLIMPLSPPLVADDIVHHRLAPNTYTQYRTPDYLYTQRVNALGLRGRDVRPERRVGTYRILVLGDSFTMGKGVSDDETFSAVLEARLNGQRGGGTMPDSFEVINAGVDSYSPILSFLQLTRLGELLSPDMVILNFDMSDLVQESVYRSAAVHDEHGEIIGISSSAYDLRNQLDTGGAIRKWIDENLYLSRLVLFSVENWAASRTDLTVRNTVAVANPELLRHTLADDDEDRTEQWERVYESILKIRDYCDRHDIAFLMTTYPWGHQVSPQEWRNGRIVFLPEAVALSSRSLDELTRFAAAEGIVLLDLFPAFRAYDGPEKLYYDTDMHWTRTGHEVMASELLRHLERGILAEGR